MLTRVCTMPSSTSTGIIRVPAMHLEPPTQGSKRGSASSWCPFPLFHPYHRYLCVFQPYFFSSETFTPRFLFLSFFPFKAGLSRAVPMIPLTLTTGEETTRRDMIITTYAHDPESKRRRSATLRRMCMIPSRRRRRAT